MFQLNPIVSILAAILASILSLGAFAEDADTAEQTEPVDRGAAYHGLGLDFGLTLFSPSEINKIISDVYEDFKTGFEMVSEIFKPRMFLGISLQCRGAFSLNRRFMLEPYGQAFCARKEIEYSVLSPFYEYIYLFFFSGGVNCWVRFNRGRLVSFKTGLGAFAGYSRIEMNGDVGRLSLNGPGFGGNILAGLDLTFRKVVVNVNFTVPIGLIRFTRREGAITLIYGPERFRGGPTPYTDYPDQMLLAGFEIRPGVTFRF